MINNKYLLGVATEEGDWLATFTENQLDIAVAWYKDYIKRGFTAILFEYSKGVFYEISKS